jgi:hypothetical protein
MAEEPSRPRGTFHEHGLLLYLDKELYKAFIKLQADRGLGRSYAGFLALVTGFYQLGYISQEVYELHIKRYSEPLEPPKPPKPVSAEEQHAKDELDKTDRVFRGMLAQYAVLSSDPAWLLKVSRWAEKYKDQLESAKELLAKVDAQTEKSTVATVDDGVR